MLQKIRNRLSLFFHIHKKEDAELAFQKSWASLFQKNKDAVLEYWKTYRYMDDVVNVTGISERSKVLDVGCGISTILHFLPGERYGIDPLADEYSKIYKYPADIHIRSGAGESIPFDDNTFDIVFCSNVLDHTENPQKVVAEISRVLTPRGFFVLTVEVFGAREKRDAAHPHDLLKEDVLSLVGNSFQERFLKESSWIGLRQYVLGRREERNKEIIFIGQK